MKPLKTPAQSLVQSIKNQLMLAGPANVEGWEDMMNLIHLLKEVYKTDYRNGAEDKEKLDQLKVDHTVLRDQYTDCAESLKSTKYAAESYAVSTRKQIKDFQERVSELIGESRQLKKNVEFANTNVGILDGVICDQSAQIEDKDAEISKLKDQVKVYQQTVVNQLGLEAWLGQQVINEVAETVKIELTIGEITTMIAVFLREMKGASNEEVHTCKAIADKAMAAAGMLPKPD